MKAISLWQPWASGMALGIKAIETRHWSTRYRGPMAIHAAKRWTAEERDMAEIMGVASNLPLGAIVAVGRLADIKRTEDLAHIVSRQEFEWGNYGNGRYGWVFADIVALPEAVPYRGAQGLFDIPDELLGLTPVVLPQGQLL